MPFPAGSSPNRSSLSCAAFLLIAVALAGCNGNQNAGTAVQKQYPDFQKKAIAKFSGKVTIDGQPPAKDTKLFVILTDAGHLDENAHAKQPKLYAACDLDGNFGFTTNEPKDGVAAGKYVVTFVQLHPPGLTAAPKAGPGYRGAGFGGGVTAKKYVGPDELKNLYNDPEKNAKEKEFSLDLQPPGKGDYEFNLSISGKEVAPVGPNAVASITSPR
jgi:predicted small secreted protein